MQYRRVMAQRQPALTRQLAFRVPKQRLTGEMKYFDCNLTTTVIAATTTTWVAGTILDPSSTINLGSAAVATPMCLFAPTVGSALNQRIGRNVKVLKIKVHGRIEFPEATNVTAAFPASNIRLILVQDCQTNATQMTGAQLMNDSQVTPLALWSFQNPNNFGRFRVLKDKFFVMQDPNEVAGSETHGRSIPFKMSVSFSTPIEVHFNATNGGTVADIVDHSFHILCATDDVSIGPQLAYYSRVCYKE